MGLLFWGVDLQPCKTMTDTLAPVERANWGVTSLEFYPRPEWCPFGLVEWSGPSGGRLVAPCLHLGGFSSSLLTPPPLPTPPRLPPTHPLVTLGLN